ncbi:MAG: 3'-5' exonuclease [Pleurocapsa sp. SU_196_0]|nr:3'-5' exonuclease [Pleurocapsa sp. SU_196_0]
MPHRRLVYPQLSRLALLALEERGEGLAHSGLLEVMGLNAPFSDVALERFLDGRFDLSGEDVRLRRWSRAFPPSGETIVALDLEATNGNPKTEDIIEIGAVKLSGAGREEFQSFVKPERPLMPFVSKLTGITPEMLVDAPPSGDVMERFRVFLGEATLVVQNASFDIALLTREFGKLSYKLHHSVVDTVNLAQAALPGKRKRGLDTLSKLYNVPQGKRHRALEDARITLSIAENLYFSLAGDRDVQLQELHHELTHKPIPTNSDSKPRKHWRRNAR